MDTFNSEAMAEKLAQALEMSKKKVEKKQRQKEQSRAVRATRTKVKAPPRQSLSELLTRPRDLPKSPLNESWWTRRN